MRWTDARLDRLAITDLRVSVPEGRESLSEMRDASQPCGGEGWS